VLGNGDVWNVLWIFMWNVYFLSGGGEWGFYSKYYNGKLGNWVVASGPYMTGWALGGWLL